MIKKENYEIELPPTELHEETEEPTTLNDLNDSAGNIVEDLLDRIGIGKFQWITYTIISIFWICDGAEVIALSLLNYVLVHVVWFQSLNDVGMMGSALFGGFFIGSIISGPITTRYGRRNPFLIYMVLVFLLGVLSAISPNFKFLVVTRSMYGVLVGILSPLTASMVTEITPKSKRGLNFVIVSSFFTIGEVIAIFLGAQLHIEEPNSEKWRYLMIWAAIPALFSLVIGLKYLEESPRYHLIKDADAGIKILNIMHRVNKKSELQLTDDEHQQVRNYVDLQKQTHTESPIREILSWSNMRITINLWISWWVLSFVYYGIVYVLPLVLAKMKKENSSGKNTDEGISYSDLFVSVLAEIPAYILAMFIIEHKSFGRKQSLMLSFALTGFCCFGAHVFVEEFFLLFVFFAKFFACAAFEFIYPLTAELYHTRCRTTGLGFASAVSRIGGVMMPWITIWALKISPTTTFVVFGGFCLLAALAVSLLPYDTTGKDLDTAHGGKN